MSVKLKLHMRASASFVLGPAGNPQADLQVKKGNAGTGGKTGKGKLPGAPKMNKTAALAARAVKNPFVL